MKSYALGIAILLSINVFAHGLINEKTLPVLADLSLLRTLNFPTQFKSEKLNVGYAVLTPSMQNQLSILAHQNGKCAGFEVVDEQPQQLFSANNILDQLEKQVEKDENYMALSFRSLNLIPKQNISDAISRLQESEVKATVEWLSSFPNRFNKSSTPNVHVVEMKNRIEKLLLNYPYPYTISLVNHSSTKQKSIVVSFEGEKRKNEIVVIGAHLDSIAQSGWGGSGDKAPGADDNASGSSNILEAMRIFAQEGQPERTVEFMWYAGEESGLLGSAEIAKSYKAQNKEVVAVLQLDMTLFPGEGELVIGSMTDFTSPWLRDYFSELNNLYIHAKVVEDQCGYGCSDHASWYRQGYPAVIPFEATMKTMNHDIHTTRDIITPKMSFKHSMAFTKIALAFALDMGNSTLKQQ